MGKLWGRGVLRQLTGQEIENCVTMARASVLKAWAYWLSSFEGLPLDENGVETTYEEAANKEFQTQELAIYDLSQRAERRMSTDAMF